MEGKCEDRYQAFNRLLDEVRQEGRYRSLRYGRLGTGVVNLSSNDYLGLASREDWRQDFLHCAQVRPGYALSSSSSRLLTGNHEEYEELEYMIADSYGRESALVFNSGYHMNLGVLPALCVGKTLILADKWVHASLIDGIRLASAECIRFRHQDMEQLERLLEEKSSLYDAVWVVCESIYSMSGDMVDLARLVAMKSRYPNVYLYVDEAHAIGVRGISGLGMAEEYGVIGQIDVLAGTFGKALASMGGFVVCDTIVKEVLVQRMRPLIFSTALPPFNVAWTSYVWKKMLGCHQERTRLHLLSAKVHSLLAAGSLGQREEEGVSSLGKSGPGHIQMWTAGNSHDALELAGWLWEQGWGGMAIRPPTVPESFAGVRFSLRANLEDVDWERLAVLRAEWERKYKGRGY